MFGRATITLGIGPHSSLLLLCSVYSFFSTTPRDWLGRTSPKWPILCPTGRKTLTQSINRSADIYTTINLTRYSVTEVGALSAAGCIRPEWQAGRLGDVLISKHRRITVANLLARRGWGIISRVCCCALVSDASAPRKHALQMRSGHSRQPSGARHTLRGPKWITRQPPEMTFVRRRLPWSA